MNLRKRFSLTGCIYFEGFGPEAEGVSHTAVLCPHHIYVLPEKEDVEEERAAPGEDMDMDLVADRYVLLSLPVKQRQSTDSAGF